MLLLLVGTKPEQINQFFVLKNCKQIVLLNNYQMDHTVSDLICIKNYKHYLLSNLLMQEGSKFVSRKQYLRVQNNQSIDQHICPICFDLILQPVQCSGSCRRKFCRQCATHTKNQHDQCPLKCSSPWNFVIVAPLPLPFTCPFSPLCNIRFTQELYDHIQSCPYQTFEFRKKHLPKRHYFCVKGHPLDFYNSSYNVMTTSKCSECKQKGACRSRCSKCDQLYCINCRPVPCSKQSCPLGHTFNIIKPYSTFLCDICGMNPQYVNQCIYSDCICNFDICGICYGRLPQKLEKLLLPYEHYCQKSHKLGYNQKSHIGNCGNCERGRLCLKYCSSCKQIYCFKCKPMVIIGIKCQLKHKLQKINLTQYHQCQYCLQTFNDSIYIDAICGFQICEDCLNIEEEKGQQRVLQKCSENHKLYLNWSPEYYFTQCCECKETVRLQYYCEICQTFYCYRCRPFNTRQGCIFKHDLEQYSGQLDQTIKCMFCHISNHQLVFCDRCNIYICQLCYFKFKH